MSEGNIPAENQPGVRRPEPGNVKQWRQELSGEATLTRLDRQGHSLRVVAAEHFSQKAADFFQRDIADEIRDPSQWVFLVEGKDSGVHETEVAVGIATQRKISIEDPVFHPFQTDIIELYLSSSEARALPREVVVGHLAAQLANARGTTDLEEVATILGVRSSGEVMMNLFLANAEKSKNPDAYINSTRKMQDDLTEISNIVSAQVLDYYLRQYKDRPNVALYLGKAHEGIATLDLSSIPERLRFDDEKIKSMIQARGMAQTRQILRAFGIDLPSREEAVLPGLSPAREEQFEYKEERRETDKVSKALGEIPGVPDNLKTAIVHWSENLFGLDYVRRRGYQEYLSSDRSLYQVWGAAAHLADLVDVARRENRNLTPQEIDTVRADFTKAAQTRSKDSEHYVKQGEELSELANGVQILEQVLQKL